MEIIPQIPFEGRLNRKLMLILAPLFEEVNVLSRNYFQSHEKRSMSWAERFKLDGFVKSRHSGENRSPDKLEPIDITGFRPSTE